MEALLVIPFGLHTVLVFFDESYHRRRGLKAWESWGHPVDVASVLLCLLVVNFLPYSRTTLPIFLTFAAISCLCITKDEFVHAAVCTPAEHWIHAVLFILHPITLGVVALAWPLAHDQPGILREWVSHPEIWRIFPSAYLVLTVIVLFYQIIYWNFVNKRGQVTE
jgi:hypothetical protein